MIPNQWYAVLESREVKTGKPVGVTRMGEKMVLWRDGKGKVSCMVDRCPHRGAALSIGKLVYDHIQCPFHGFEYDCSGDCTLIPANGRNANPPKVFHVQTYPTFEAHDFIFIWWGESRADLPPVKFFDSIDETFSYMTLKDLWNIHYSRAIENQLDVVHLPFVHHNTIGRGNRTLVDGPLSEFVEDNLLDIYVFNRVDDGRPPIKPRQLQRPSRYPFLQLRFPNLWHNWISDQVRIVIAFVPIDDQNTKMYIRYYQNIVRTPLLRELVNLSGIAGSFIIERQDRRVVVTQRPMRSGLHIGEKMIQGDGPVINYRRRREELIGSLQKEVHHDE